MFKVERSTAIPVGIDGLLASLSSIVFSVTPKFAILVHWLFLTASVLMLKVL